MYLFFTFILRSKRYGEQHFYRPLQVLFIYLATTCLWRVARTICRRRISITVVDVTVVVIVVTVVTDHGFRCRCCCCHAWKRFQSSVPSLGSVPSLAVNASESSCCCCCAWNLNGGPLDGGALMKLYRQT